MSVLMKSDTTKRSAGRPRSEEARKAILQATMRLLDKSSVRQITIESIAREAGVGKVTIYRWWTSKTQLMVDAFMETMLPRTPMPKPGAKLPDLSAHIAALIREYQGKFGRIVAEIIAEGQFEKDALAYFREALISKRRTLALAIVDAAKERKEINAQTDTDLLIDMLYGPIYFRLLVGHKPLDSRLARGIGRFLAEISAKQEK